jgi:transposase
LAAALQETTDARVYRRLLGLSQLADGQAAMDVARMLGVSRQALYKWIESFRNEGVVGLQEREGRGRPSLWTPELEEGLKAALNAKPEHFGYLSTEWTVPLLIEHLARSDGPRLSDDTVRRELDRLGYVWKRPRYVLLPDPAREKKTLDSAHSVSPRERALGSPV